MNNKKINSKIKLSNNSSFVILIFVIWNFEIFVVLHFVVPNFDPHSEQFPHYRVTPHAFKILTFEFLNSRHFNRSNFWSLAVVGNNGLSTFNHS